MPHHTAKIIGMSSLKCGLARLYTTDDEGTPRTLTVVDPPPYLIGIVGERIGWDDTAVVYKGLVIAHVVEGARRGEIRIRFTKQGADDAAARANT